jgi:two-component system, NtrC family, nitrogen regulation sensor histidine kinase NtrY
MPFKQKPSSKQRVLIYISSGILLLIVFYLAQSFFYSRVTPDYLTRHFQEELMENQVELQSRSKDIVEVLVKDNQPVWPELENAVEDDNLIAQIYLNDSLFFWNSQLIDHNILMFSIHTADSVVKLNTGWYLMQHASSETYRVFLFKQIKPEYSFNNSYLPQHIHSEFISAEGVMISSYQEEGPGNVIYDVHQRPVITLMFTGDDQLSPSMILLLFLLYVIIFFLVILLLEEGYLFFSHRFHNKLLLFFLFILDLFILRLLDYFLGIPVVVKQSFIFNEGTDLLFGWQSLGDQLINTLIISVIAIKAYQVIKPGQNQPKVLRSLPVRIIVPLMYWLIPFVIFYLLHHSFLLLEYNPDTGIDLSGLEGYLLIINAQLLLVSLYFFTVSLDRILVINKKARYFTALSIPVLGLLFWLVVNEPVILLSTFFFSILMFIVSLLPEIKQDIRIAKYILMTIILSVSAALLINEVRESNRDEHQIMAGEFVSVSHDEAFEKHYASIYNSLTQDDQFSQLLADSSTSADALLNYLKNEYFSAFMDKYTMQLTVCHADDSLLVLPAEVVVNCADYFQETLVNWGKSTPDSTLFLVSSAPTRIDYLARVTFSETDDIGQLPDMYLEFFYFIIPEGLGYPELLVDDHNMNVDLSGYSYAIYEDDRLIYKLGSFSYFTSYSLYAEFPDKTFFEFQDYKHYKFLTDNGNYLIISRPQTRISEQLVTFSALFLIFVIITFMTLIVAYGRSGKTRLAINFRNRLQLVFISTTSLIISAMALITLLYVEANNTTNLMDQLTEKTYSVIIELEQKLELTENYRDIDPEMMHDLLRKFSLVFFSDIHVYEPSGKVLASSRPEIFEKGLISDIINPMAYEELFFKHKLLFITDESIGNASYYSAYAPLNFGTDKTVCILNLPYFAKQSEVRTTYVRMLFTYINVFVIFGILGAFLSLLLTRILARPLLLLQNNIRNIRIDKKNEKISWNRDDEIGMLIEEYNRMVDKLEQSAELLKHSERESTWREVAQQIAHEIKNPLTPMKLNVQYLEKAYQENDPEFKSRIKTVSASLISQIDSLDKVAEMFSDFAKAGNSNLEKVNLEQVIQSSVSLYKSHDWISFHIEVEDDNLPYLVYAIEKDLLRVFNNLLKNAIQAMEEKKKGRIEITLNRNGNYIVATVSDTGKGIAPHEKASIFQPYFTTKSGGTGLGLAIVKNIIAEIGGEIGFQSLEGAGTTFTLKFKSAHSD